ncbi:hypothetical protein AB1E18_002653 [Capra hircus]
MAAGFLRASKGESERPVPSPQILMGSTSITPDWCNVTLECRAPGAREDLNVTWENKGLPKEWEQRRTLEQACNSYILAVSLPRGQPNASLICVVSNPVGYKTASFNLGGVCVHEPYNDVAILPSGIDSLWVAVANPTLTGARSQDDDDDSIQYVELSQQESQVSSNKVTREQHLKERVPLTTIYSEVCKPGHAVKVEQKTEGQIGSISSWTSQIIHKIPSRGIPSNMFHFITP